MLDSIFIGMSGLLGYSQGLRVIANNTANLNTPGFKGSTLQFADVYQGAGGRLDGSGADPASRAAGQGLTTTRTTLDFRAGELRQTGNDLDLAVDGPGLFVLRQTDGSLRYTRDGQFQFDADGRLVSRTDGAEVQGLGEGGLSTVALTGLRANPAKPSATLRFAGNLSSTAAEQTVNGVGIVDASGGAHDLAVVLKRGAASAPGTWTVTVRKGETVVGEGTIAFVDGRPVADRSTVAVTFRPEGQAEQPLVLDFSGEVTSFAAGDLSTLALAEHDGHAAGALSRVAFDATGRLALTYSNGETAKGASLALARFDSIDAVEAAGSNGFRALDETAWHTGTAGDAYGSVRSGAVEISNVDLSKEFADLVVMQRGYQASSQIVATANEMLQELYGMKGA